MSSRFVKSGLICAITLASITAAIAQQAGAPALSPWMMAMQSGNYNFESYDKGRVQSEFTAIIRQRGETDFQYFQTALNTLDSDFKRLLQDAVFSTDDDSPGLYTLSNQSIVGQQPVDAMKVANAQNRFREAKLALQNRIALFSSISENFPSQQVSAQGSGVATIPNYGNMNFTRVTDPVVLKLAEIENTVKNLGYWVTFPADMSAPPKRIAPNTGKGLETISPSTAIPLDQIEKIYIPQMNALKVPSRLTRDSRDAAHKFSIQMIREFMKQYGSAEKWRWRNETDLKNRTDKFKEIVDVFFHRSFIRAIYGMPLCAIGVPYKKESFNLDIVTGTTESLSQTFDAPVCFQKEFQEQRTNYTNILERTDARSKKILPNILKGQIGPVQTFESFTTWVAGNRSYVEAINLIMGLLAADFYEEELLVQTGGLTAMNLRFKDRYLAREQERSYYEKLAHEFDPETFGLDEVPMTWAEGSVREKYGKLLSQAKFQNAQLQRAKEIQDFINIASNAENNIAAKNSKKRATDLFGKPPGGGR